MYTYFVNWHAYKAKQIPSRYFFYNNLKNAAVDEDYLHAKNVFEEFEMKTLVDYTIMYLYLHQILGR